MAEINPENPLVASANGQWHKILAILMVKRGIRNFRITMADTERVAKDVNVVMRDDGGSLVIEIKTDAEAAKMLADFERSQLKKR